MLDHPEKTARLLVDLTAAVPFEVELTPPLIRQLQAENVPDVGQKHLVCDLSYAGDEGGIVCHLSRSEETSLTTALALDAIKPNRAAA